MRARRRTCGAPSCGRRAIYDARARSFGVSPPERETTCAVIGAGLGGCALVASMALSGYRMRLHDLNDARLVEIRDRGGIEVAGLFTGFARVELATPELGPAVDGADILIVCTGSNKHADLAQLLAKRLRDGQT